MLTNSHSLRPLSFFLVTRLPAATRRLFLVATFSYHTAPPATTNTINGLPHKARHPTRGRGLATRHLFLATLHTHYFARKANTVNALRTKPSTHPGWRCFVSTDYQDQAESGRLRQSALGGPGGVGGAHDFEEAEWTEQATGGDHTSHEGAHDAEDGYVAAGEVEVANRGARGEPGRLGAGLIDHLGPGAFGFEDEFDEFAGGAFAAGGGGDVVGRPLDLNGGIADGYG
jgi:hypothetical protein